MSLEQFEPDMSPTEQFQLEMFRFLTARYFQVENDSQDLWRAELYAEVIMAEVNRAFGPAMAAANINAPPTWQPPRNPLADEVGNKACELYLQLRNDRHHKDMRARAFALTLAAEISGGLEERALYAARLPIAPETELERQHRLEREREEDLMARRRRRPSWRQT